MKNLRLAQPPEALAIYPQKRSNIVRLPANPTIPDVVDAAVSKAVLCT